MSNYSSENIVKAIHRKAHRKYSAEEKIRIVLEGLCGEESIAERDRSKPELVLLGKRGQIYYFQVNNKHQKIRYT